MSFKVRGLTKSLVRRRAIRLTVAALMLPLTGAGAWLALASSPASSAIPAASLVRTETCTNGTGQLKAGTDDPPEPGGTATYTGTFTGLGNTCLSTKGAFGTPTVIPQDGGCVVSAPVLPGARLVTNSGTYRVLEGTARMILPTSGGPALLEVDTTLDAPGGGTATGTGTGTILDTRLEQVCITSTFPAGTYAVTNATGTVLML